MFTLRRLLAETQCSIVAQGNAVRGLKAAKAPNAVNGNGNGAAFRESMVDTLERKLFYIPSSKITGLYNYGPEGSALKINILKFWRKHFVREENMFEVDFPDKFTGLMVKDEKTGNCYRAVHLVKDFCNEMLHKDLSISEENAAELKHVLAFLDVLSAKELDAIIKGYGIVAPDTKNPLSEPYPFNLMFGLSPGYMRPQTAHGIFVNFTDLYCYNGNKLPFAAAQIGEGFRNKVQFSPCPGLLRLREFTLAEIEHFVDPEDKSHPKYSEVEQLEFLMFPREQQMSGQSAKIIRLGEAVSKGIVNNETLGYFIGRVYLFLTRLGIDKDRLRFRQHLANEMAHCAADCWAAEIECSYGWIECVGIADRSLYDLRAHTKLVITPAKKELGLAFKGEQENVVEALEAMNEKEAMEMRASLESKGEVEFYVCTLRKNVCIKDKMVSIKKEEEHQQVFTPSVIEPSFGIGRIIYCLYEHSFYTRPSKSGDEELNQLNVFRFPPLVAPTQCTVFPLVREYEQVAKEISRSLRVSGISLRIDRRDISIGEQYARRDELGVPFTVTVDSTSSVTIRERDSKDQIRVNVEEAAAVVSSLVDGQRTWADVWSSFPRHLSGSTEVSYVLA